MPFPCATLQRFDKECVDFEVSKIPETNYEGLFPPYISFMVSEYIGVEESFYSRVFVDESLFHIFSRLDIYFARKYARVETVQFLSF